MADHIEVETKDLQEQIEELQEERVALEKEQKQAGWIRYIGLSTAILAVFAAMAALQSGNLVNEALINQIKASDTWSEYQASRQKDYMFTLALDGVLDSKGANRTSRTTEYRAKIRNEASKETALGTEARKLEEESAQQIRKHERFEYSVALIQVAIALGAVAALARVKAVWYASILAGSIGVVLFFLGFFG